MGAQPNRGASGPAAPRAVLLDAMGTLLTFAPPAPLLREALRERLGVDIGPDAARAAIAAEIAYYRAHVDDGRDERTLAGLRRRAANAMRPALPQAAGASDEVLTEALLASLHFEAYPDAAPALRRLRTAGVRLVVVSNWDVSLHDRLAETGLAPLIDGAIASAQAGVAKPDPRIFGRALALAGVGPAAALHVGDSVPDDVAGARAAGIRPVLIAREAGPEPPPGVPVIRSLSELGAQGEYPVPSRR